MAKGDIYLGLAGSETLLSPIGREFQEGEVEGSRTDRTASGRLVRDIMWSKKNFTLDYSDAIDGDVLTILKNIYALQTELSLIVHYTDTIVTTYTVLMKPFKRTRKLLTGNQLWSGTSIELEEV